VHNIQREKELEKYDAFFLSPQSHPPPDLLINSFKLLETMFHATKTQLYKVLPVKAFAHLASTSKTMFRFLSPMISDLFITCVIISMIFLNVGQTPIGILPSKIDLKYYKPAKLTNIATTKVPQCVTEISFSNSMVRSILQKNFHSPVPCPLT
jgi:hypothetical protein